MSGNSFFAFQAGFPAAQSFQLIPGRSTEMVTDDNNFFNKYKKNQENVQSGEEAMVPEPAESAAGTSAAAGTETNAGRSVPPAPAGRKSIFGSKNSKNILLIGAASLAVIIIIFALISSSGAKAENFAGWKISDLQLWCSQNGIELKVEREFSDVTETDKIISADIAEGTRMRKGDFLSVVVSNGHDPSVIVPLPDLMNMTAEEINKWVNDNYLTKVRITTEYSSKVPEGRVIRFEVNDDSVVSDMRRDSPVYIVISKKSAASETVTVIDLVGKPLDEANAFAKENGIKLKIEKEYSEIYPVNTVIKQGSAPLETIYKGDELEIQVSLGKKIIIPNFSGLSPTAAALKSAELGIQTEIVNVYSSKAKNTFVSQSISSGKVYKHGDILTLKYSLGNKILIESFVGRSRGEFDLWVSEQNEKGAKIKIKETRTQNQAVKDTVIHQDRENVMENYDVTINIVVSRGMYVFVPDFINSRNVSYDDAMLREEAMKICHEMNLVPIFIEESNSAYLPGQVWYQSISPGTEVAEGTKITLKYNPANMKYPVPDFKGRTEAQIKADSSVMNKFSIRFETLSESVPGYEGKASGQSVKPGSTAAAGSEIIVYISPNP